jgi:hypothetical protein
MPDDSKILSLKARRVALQAKLDDWEATHVALHGRPSTEADRQRSREHRELSKLLVDLDGFVASLEGGGGSAQPHAPGTQDAERRAERGRIKAKMRRWERNFERTHNRRPTEADIEASDEMTRLRTQLRGEMGSTAAAEGSGGEGGALVDAAAAASSSVNDGLLVTDSPANATPDDGTWLRGNDYHEVLRARVRSQAAVNGFAGVSQAEAHAAASSFAAWDLDRDGVLSRTEFETVVQSLADGPPLDDETVVRLFALVDRDESGDIDFNEWLAVFSQLGGSAHGSAAST